MDHRSRARDRARARALPVAAPASSCKLYVLADPAPGDDGNDDRGASPRRPAGGVGRRPRRAPSPPSPRFTRPSSGYKGTASDPWRGPAGRRAAARLRRRRRPATSSRAPRPGSTACGKRDLTLAIGFGADAGGRRRHGARARWTAASRHAAGRFAAGWQLVPALAGAPAGGACASSPPLRRALRAVADGARRLGGQGERGASIAAPNMPWVWGTLTLSRTRRLGPVSPRLAARLLPRGHRAEGGRRRRGGRPACSTTCGASRSPTARGGRTRAWTAREYWTALQLDEVALPVVLAWWLGPHGAADWAHIQRAADFIVANGPADRRRSAGRTRSGWSPNTIATEIAALVCAADVARANGDAGARRGLRGDRGRVAGAGRGLDGDDERPVLATSPYYLPLTKDGQPGRRQHVQPRRQLPAPGGRARDRRQLVPRARAVRRQAVGRPDRAQLARGRRRAARGRHAQRPDLAPVLVRRLRRDRRPAATGTSSPTAERQTRGRVWPLLAGERGEYELLAGGDARPHLRTIAAPPTTG